jgi:hypothetical protein
VRPVVFLSYRHDDAQFVRGLQVALEHRLPGGSIIRDLGAFRGGDDLRTVISRALEEATVVLSVIGPGWMKVDSRTCRPRLREGDDWVRFELSLALAWNRVVIPVLIDATPMPDRHDLPTDVALVATKVAHRVRDSDWEADVGKLAALIAPGYTAPTERRATEVEAGPIAGGNVTITGTNVAGRDLNVKEASPPFERRGRWWSRWWR